MSKNELKKLKINDRLTYEEASVRNNGIVTEVGYCAVRIKWDDGYTSTLRFNDDYSRSDFLPLIERVR